MSVLRWIGASVLAGALALTTVSMTTRPAAHAKELASTTTCTWTQPSADVTTAMVSGVMNAVTVIAATDAWAVGQYNTGSATGSFWENWNGSAWAVVGGGGAGANLVAVTNFGVNDVVAVGSDSTGTALIALWNGTSIMRATLPSVGISSTLDWVSGTSASDIWAEGTYSTATVPSALLLYHFNGQVWVQVTAPPGGFADDAILALTPTDVLLPVYTAKRWGVPTLYQWNGSKWSVSKTTIQPPAGYKNRAYGFYGPFVGTAANHLSLMLGFHTGANYSSVPYTLNGKKWTYVNSPNKSYDNSIAYGPNNEVWSAGQDNDFKGDYPDGILLQENGNVLIDPEIDDNSIFLGIAVGAGVVIAVGGDEDFNNPYTPGQPIVYVGTGCT